MKNEPLAANTKLMFSSGLPDQMIFNTEEDWRKSMSKEPLKIRIPITRLAWKQATGWCLITIPTIPTIPR
jgi:hypothetical protein